MIKLKQVVVVEGKYDKIKLESVLNTVILVTDGFGIYKNKEKLELIKAFARKDGIIILTDSDHSGFQIRNYLKSVIKNGKIWHVYTPDIYGKEKRKEKPSSEGKLGVEGIDIKIIREAFIRAGIADISETMPHTCVENINIIRERLYDDGFIGKTGSAARKKSLLKILSLPENLSTSALIEIMPLLYGRGEYEEAVKIIKKYELVSGEFE